MGASAVSRSARIDQSFNASASMRRTGVSGRSKASRAAREKAAAVAGDGPRKLVADPAHPNLTVWENGKDVTPLSLIKLAGAGGATSDHASAAGSLDQPSLITAAKESMGMGMSSSMYESASNLADGSFADAGGGPAAQQNAGAAGGDQVVAWSANARSKAADDSAADALAAPLTVAELAASITLLLRETETFFWLDVEGDVVGKEIPAEHAAVVANNERVARLAAARPNTLDKYSQRAAQTFAFELKARDAHAAPRSATQRHAARRDAVHTRYDATQRARSRTQREGASKPSEGARGARAQRARAVAGRPASPPAVSAVRCIRSNPSCAHRAHTHACPPTHPPTHPPPTLRR
jgi:hypothetical protein